MMVLVMAALLIGGGQASAQKKVTKQATPTKVAKAAKAKKGKAAKGTKAQAAAAVIDTVTVPVFSYDMGLVQTEGLKPYLAQRLGVDTTKMDDFMRGYREAISKSGDKSLGAYAAGIQIGQQLMDQILPALNKRITDKDGAKFIDENEFKEGFTAGITGQGQRIKADSAMNVVRRQMDYYHAKLMEQKYGDNRKDGEKFLADNLKQPGVKLIPGSKVQYKVITEGKGEMPKATDKVKVNYEGKLIDGTVFDSSYKRNKPATFECDRVIKGWTEALTHMPVGSTWEIYIPQELAYGDRETGDKIKPFSTLIFKVELLEIEKPKAAESTNKK